MVTIPGDCPQMQHPAPQTMCLCFFAIVTTIFVAPSRLLGRGGAGLPLTLLHLPRNVLQGHSSPGLTPTGWLRQASRKTRSTYGWPGTTFILCPPPDPSCRLAQLATTGWPLGARSVSAGPGPARGLGEARLRGENKKAQRIGL